MSRRSVGKVVLQLGRERLLLDFVINVIVILVLFGGLGIMLIKLGFKLVEGRMFKW